MRRPKMLAIAVVTSIVGVPAIGKTVTPHVGDTYEITMIREMAQKSSDDSTGSSFDKDTIIERVIDVRDGGTEIEYDLPKSPTNEEAKDWKFPVRVLRPQTGPLQLLNRAELEGRVDKWLRAAKWTRDVCGRWLFSWNAFRIECDPQVAVTTIETFDLSEADLRDGAPYQEGGALSTGILRKQKASAEGETFVVQMDADPDAVRRMRAESDVAVSEMLQKPVTIEAALLKRAEETVSGTISITFETGPTGVVRRRTKVTELRTQTADGHSTTETVTQTLERRMISEPVTS